MAPLLDLTEQLRHLGDALGRARDCSLRCHTLTHWVVALGLTSSGGPRPGSVTTVGDPGPLLSLASDELAAALTSLERSLNSAEYEALLRGLARLASDAAGPLGSFAQVSADGILAQLCARQFSALTRQVKRAKRGPSEHRLHRARIQAKKLRYLGELAFSLASGRTARKTKTAAALAERLQDVLGELHDAAEMCRWLQGAVDGLGEQTALAAGRLVALCQREQNKWDRKWARAWRSLDKQIDGSWPGARGPTQPTIANAQISGLLPT
jgi:hypothetical protein